MEPTDFTDDQIQKPLTPPEAVAPSVGDDDAREALQAVITEEQHKLLARFALILLMCILLVSMLYVATPHDSLMREGLVKKLSIPEKAESAYFLPLNPFPTVELTAESAFVYDLNTGEQLFAKNAESQLPLASITKLMTILVAAEIFGTGGSVHMNPDATATDPTHISTLQDSWLPKDIFTYTLVQSSNEGARAIASAAGSFAYSDTDLEVSRDRFVDLMNEKAKELGLTQTYFLNETGLDETVGTGGSYGSAKDMAILMGEIIKEYPETLEGTRHSATPLTTLSDIKHVAINTNTDLQNLPGLIGSKTGFTDLAGGNLIIAYDPGIGRPVVAAVLGSTLEGRFQDIRTLLHATLTYFGNETKAESL